MKSLMIAAVVILVVGAGAAAGLLWSGSYNVAADEPHYPAVHRLLEIGRERSVAVRAAALEVPDLSNAELLRRGAGNYAAMCEGCHLRPGMGDTELRRGLYPQPPELSARDGSAPARDFWIIKHGLKASGMPAWGLSMEDDAIWGMAAFLRWLPGRSPEEYQAAVSASSGHSHGDADAEMTAEPDGHDTVPHEHGEHEG
jgi:mono/diheme cytochrome c family protein